MKLQDIIIKAKEMGIDPNITNKTDLIRAIQRAEFNLDCFATGRADSCEELGCLWRADCIEPKKKKQPSTKGRVARKTESEKSQPLYLAPRNRKGRKEL